MGLGTPSCLFIDDGYLFAGPHVYASQHGFCVYKTDLLGEVKWLKSFEFGSHYVYAIGGGILTPTHDGNYLLVGSRTYEIGNQNRDIVMLKFDEEGTLLFTNIIEKNDTIESPYHIIPTSDGGYIMAGIQRNFDTNNRFYVLKTDALGNKEWDKVLQGDIKGVGASISEAYDGGYITSGYISDTITKADMYVAKLDLQGNVEWEKTYHVTPNTDIGAYITKWKNNKYLLTGGIRPTNIREMYIAQLDIEGAVEWEKIYNIEENRVIQARPIILADGFISTTYTFSDSDHYNSQLIRFDLEGNIVWETPLLGDDADDNWYLKDIDTTADGGYILSGFNYSEQSSWIVKTDSLGNTCEYVGCEETIVIDHVDDAFATLTTEPVVYTTPNPTHDFLHIHNPTSAACEWQFYTPTGKLLFRQLVAAYSERRVSVRGMAAGMYVWRAGAYSGKVVVE